jgi:hypothetical protein
MHIRLLNVSTFAALILVSVAAAAQTLDEQTAQQFVPPAFAAFAAANTYLSDNQTESVLPIDLDQTGRNDYLAVAYGNGHIAYLRVIRKGAVAALAGDSASAMQCDSAPSVSAVDLDGDGKPELILTCTVGNRGRRFSSLFKWTGAGLSTLNPPSARRSNAWEPIAQTNFADIDGNGVLAIVSPSCPFTVSEDGVVDKCWSVYRLVNGRFTKSAGGDIVLFELYVRDTGKPEAETKKFAAAPGPYQLTIVNGERGQNRVSSAVITLNGANVASPNSFSKNTPVIASDVILGAQNTLSVELRSSPGSFIHVLLTPKQP